MKTFQLKTLTLGLVLVVPWIYAATPRETTTVALNCPDGNIAPNCPSRVPDGKKRAPPQADEQAQQGAQQEQQKTQLQQQARQRAQQEQQRAQQQQQAQQRAEQEQQRTQQQQQVQQRAQHEQQRAQQQQQVQQRAEQEQQRTQQQQQVQQRAQQEQQRAQQQQQVQQRAQQEQQRAQQQQQVQQRAQQEQQRTQQQQQAQQRAQQEQQRTQRQKQAQQEQQQQAQQRAEQEQQRAQRVQPDVGRPGIPAQPAQATATAQGQRPPADPRRPGLESAPGQPPADARRPGLQAASGQPPVTAKGQMVQAGQPPVTAQGQQPPADARRPGLQAAPGQPPVTAKGQMGQAGQPPVTAQGQQPPADGGRPGLQADPGQPPVTAQGQRPPADERRPGPDVRRPVPAQPVAVDTATSVVPRGDRSSFDIRHKNNDGSQTVISQTRRPDGTRPVTGFKQTEDARNGTTTRFYSDGRSSVQGRDFDKRSVQSGMSFVRNENGLREARLPDGKPSYQDRFVSYRGPTGEQRQAIERTHYARWDHGRPVYAARPVVRHYDVGHIHGAPAPYYRPQRYAPGFYSGYYARFAVPVVLAAFAGAAWVAYDTPATTYYDPANLMGDMQISSGFEEGYSYAAPSDALPVYDSQEAAALRNQMATVQQQVRTSIQADPALRQQLGGVDFQATSSQVQQAVGGAVPVQISEDVRQQIRQQVRLSVAMLQNGKPLVLADVLASGYTKIYLFQTAQPLNVAKLSAGGECFLNTGDLIGFAELPTADSPVAEMKVVASGATSCRPDEVVQVRLTDLQEMLNRFAERVEDNMTRVTACSASGGC